jgi:mannose/cellobiose epimerase-like protein (N-acyl-D-glucosamine 2-epimerase family)
LGSLCFFKWYTYSKALNDEHGGLIYGFAPNGECCDDDKCFWVQVESFAAAGALIT